MASELWHWPPAEWQTRVGIMHLVPPSPTIHQGLWTPSGFWLECLDYWTRPLLPASALRQLRELVQRQPLPLTVYLRCDHSPRGGVTYSWYLEAEHVDP